MQKRKLTQEDIDNNPELANHKAGDEIEIPETNESDESTDDEGENEDTGGSNPPPNKERP
jgi:hypothetical protein